MLRYRIIWVGRKARDPLLEAADDYLGRLGHYARPELVCVRESQGPECAARLEKKVGSPPLLVALDERGEQLTTAALAKRIEGWTRAARGPITFVIGGADGLPASVKKRAHKTIALSSMTLPHRLALVVLLEQLYRAHTILRGESYHRG